MTASYPIHFACWSGDDARHVLATEALEGHEAQFMATHLPITGFDIKGSHATEIGEPHEDALLASLIRPNLRHAFCVVEGEAGSGKSHLIRWLRVKWSSESDLVLLVQRADGSLEGTLRQLRNKLPPAYQDLLQGIGQRQEATLIGRSRFFQASLAQTLRPDFFESPILHSEWSGEWRLDELINHNAVLEHWRAPRRILEILSGAEGRRNSALADFNLYDVAELSALQTYIENPSTKMLRFLRLLKKEADEIYPLQKEKVAPGDAWQRLEDRVPQSKKLVEALNARMNTAVQNLLGISSHELRELFFKLRAGLKREGRRLVLLLEDITTFQGIDNQLIDVLVTQSTTRAEDDLCDLISVVGITPDYYHQHLRTYANYVERITYHLVLGAQVDEHFQDVAFLRDEGSQVAFAARYLAAVRTGTDTLASWYSSTDGPLPNKCVHCRFQEPCHLAFGESEGIGLYPFTSGAISRMFLSLEDPAGANTWKTPRGMIQGVLSPTLLHPETIQTGQYPSAQIEVAYLPDSVRRLTGLGETLLRNSVDDENMHARLRRLIALWGDKQKLETTGSGTSEAFAGISRGVFEAFGVPWLGEANLQTQTPNEGAGTPPEQGPVQEASANVLTDIPSKNQAAGPAASTGKSSKTSTAGPSSTQVQKRLDQIAAWRDGKKLEDPTFWQKQLVEFIFKLPWTQLGIAVAWKNRFFTENSIRIEGTGKSDTRHFVVPAEDWLKGGLDSLLSLKTDTAGGSLLEVHRRLVARMHRKLCHAVREHIAKKIPLLEDGTPWSVVGAATQVLAVRAWLRGASSPLRTTASNWSELLSDELDATSSPEQRVPSWDELLSKTRGSHDKVREMLRQLVQLPQGNSPEFGTTAVGDAASALLSLQSTFQLCPSPTKEIAVTEQTADIAKTSQYATETRDRIGGLPEREYERLHEHACELEAMLREFSIREHVKRVDQVVRGVTTHLPQAAPLQVENWQKAQRKLEGRGFLDPGVSAIADEVEAFLNGARDLPAAPNFPSIAAMFDWVLSAPAGPLTNVCESLRIGEATIKGLYDYVNNFLTSQKGSQSNRLSEIQALGEKTTTICAQIAAGLEKTNG
ncbi:MAG: hypothetical protein DME82_05730 [Verrucomicrobia bacterium]|nr:MAG: hypothetical protein DME82_05730 [Verrucomicrobiota bacterium]